jgi:RecA-family ATPase
VFTLRRNRRSRSSGKRSKADIIIVDTLTAAFEIENENDNAEGSRIMKKLTGLAQRLNCVVVFLHHIGKAKQEEGQTSQVVHSGRGGSSYSSFSHAISN